MRFSKNLLILFLSLTTVSGAIVAWHQYQELVQLRGTVAKIREPSHAPTPTSPMNAVIHHAAPSLAGEGPPIPEAEPTTGEMGALGPRPGREGGPGQNFRAMMDRPEVQRLMAIQQKSALDSRYASLFKNLGLSPQQLERFKELLVEKRTAASDVRSAAREQGLNARNDPAAYKKLLADAEAEIDASIRETLGESGFAQYDAYEKTLPQRNLVNQLEQRLSYSSTPLSSHQSEQLVSILAATTQSAQNPNRVATPLPGGGNGPAAFQMRANDTRITDATINQALGVLAAPQIEALRQLQQEQEAQTALNAAMRNRFRDEPGATPAGGPIPGSTSGPQSLPTPRRSGG